MYHESSIKKMKYGSEKEKNDNIEFRIVLLFSF